MFARFMLQVLQTLNIYENMWCPENIVIFCNRHRIVGVNLIHDVYLMRLFTGNGVSLVQTTTGFSLGPRFRLVKF